MESRPGRYRPENEHPKPTEQPSQPEHTQPLQGAAGKQSLQGPTAFDGHDPDAGQHVSKQQRVEGNPLTSPLEQKEKGDVKKPSRISGQKTAFIQHAYAAGADDKLDERLRLFIAHAVTKPYLTLKEIGLFAGVKAERARSLWDTGIRTLWEASPPELQQQYPLNILRRHRLTGVAISAERKARIGAAHRGKQVSSETRSLMSAKRKERKFSQKARDRMSEGQQKRWERRRQQETTDRES